jgi:hypothetical protein
MTSTSNRPVLLSPEHIALIASGVSTIVASRDAAHRPSMMRAVGASITPQGDRITVYLNRASSAQLLADLQATGHIAVVFSEPSTHRTVQVKASQVQVRHALATDTELLQRYLSAMEVQLNYVGFGPHYTRIMLAHQPEDVVAVSFTPEQAFDQTPGPKAGARLPRQGGAA